jgi:hypothetical protein
VRASVNTLTFYHKECFPTSAAVLVLERDGPVQKTIGDIRVGDIVQSVSNGKLDWSTVYVDLHRSAGLATFTHLITANATLRLSEWHMVPALVGGCELGTRDTAKWVPAALLKVGDGIFTPLVCSPIVALGSSEEHGYANPITFSSHIVVDGVLATVWAFVGHPDGRPGMYADGDVTSTWKTANEIVVQYPFKAIYFITRPAYLLLPWPSTRVMIDEFMCELGRRWVDIVVVKNHERSNYPKAVAKFAALGILLYAVVFVALRRALVGFRGLGIGRVGKTKKV